MEIKKVKIKTEEKLRLIDFKMKFPTIVILEGEKYWLESYENYEATYIKEV